MAEQAARRADGEMGRIDRLYPRVAGALIAAAAGDALGWITEFVRGVDHLRTLYHTDFVTDYRPWQKTTGGRFNAYVDYISKGQYSDDTQLTLATARSLLPDGSIDVDHFASKELPLWLDYARGAGRTVTAAARGLRRKSSRWNHNFFDQGVSEGSISYRNAGANGAAMRIAPIAIANRSNPARMTTAIVRNAVTTHGHPRAILGALIYGEALRFCLVEQRFSPQTMIESLIDFSSAIQFPVDPDLEVWLREWDRGSTQPFERLWDQTLHEVRSALTSLSRPEGEADWKRALVEFGCFDRQTRGSGTATVLAALAIFYHIGAALPRAVVTAVNQIGTDTDTIAGFVGGLCGAVHGYDAVPRKWASELQDYDYFMRVATELTSLAAGNPAMGGRALLPAARDEFQKLPDLVTQLRNHSVNEGELVYHPLFGRGTIRSVEAQVLRRRDGAQAVFAWVEFFIGQTCKFRYIEVPRRGSRRSPKQVMAEPTPPDT